MPGRKERDRLELFMTGSLRQLVPDDHILARVDCVLDLSWFRAEVAELDCKHNGRPGIDPEVAVRPILAGFLLGIVHARTTEVAAVTILDGLVLGTLGYRRLSRTVLIFTARETVRGPPRSCSSWRAPACSPGCRPSSRSRPR